MLVTATAVLDIVLLGVESLLGEVRGPRLALLAIRIGVFFHELMLGFHNLNLNLTNEGGGCPSALLANSDLFKILLI